MKRSLPLFLAVLAVAGCATADVAPAGDNVARIRGLYESFGRGDVQAVLGALDPQVVWYEAEGFAFAEGNPYVGPQRVAEGVFGGIAATWDGFRVTPERFYDAGESVIVEGRYAATSKATGRRLDAQFAHIFTLRNGRIVRFQQYTDTAQTVSVMSNP